MALPLLPLVLGGVGVAALGTVGYKIKKFLDLDDDEKMSKLDEGFYRSVNAVDKIFDDGKWRGSDDLASLGMRIDASVYESAMRTFGAFAAGEIDAATALRRLASIVEDEIGAMSEFKRYMSDSLPSEHLRAAVALYDLRDAIKELREDGADGREIRALKLKFEALKSDDLLDRSRKVKNPSRENIEMEWEASQKGVNTMFDNFRKTYLDSLDGKNEALNKQASQNDNSNLSSNLDAREIDALPLGEGAKSFIGATPMEALRAARSELGEGLAFEQMTLVRAASKNGPAIYELIASKAREGEDSLCADDVENVLRQGEARSCVAAFEGEGAATAAIKAAMKEIGEGTPKAILANFRTGAEYPLEELQGAMDELGEYGDADTDTYFANTEDDRLPAGAAQVSLVATF